MFKIHIRLKKLLRIIILIIIVIISNIMIFIFFKEVEDNELYLCAKISSDQSQNYQVFYSLNGEWSEDQSLKLLYDSSGKNKTLQYAIPKEAKYIRFDFGEQPGTHTLWKLYFESNSRKLSIMQDILQITDEQKNMIGLIKESSKSINVVSVGDDPYVVINVQRLELSTFVSSSIKHNLLLQRIFLCCLLDLALLCLYWFRTHVRIVLSDLLKSRSLIFQLSKDDFKNRFAGSFFGVFWAFVQPVVMVLVFWFVFQRFFKSGDIGDYPFILWLIAGLGPWLFFQETITLGTACLLDYSYLVKKVVFNISTLPTVRIISSLFVHLFYVFVMLVIYIAYGHKLDGYIMEILYYLLCLIVLEFGIIYFSCSVAVFFRDIGQLIGIFLQIFMWVTPIMWNYTMLSEFQQKFLLWNPLFYITNGYRNALINKEFFWNEPISMFIFWFETTLIFIVGTLIFRKLKPHFADIA